MKIFLDSADIDEVRDAKSFGILEGVTTNPSLIKKAARKHKVKDMEEYITILLRECKGIPVSLEVIGTDYESMLEEGKTLFKKFNSVAHNVVVKIPVNPAMRGGTHKASDGIKVIKELSKSKIPVNCTLIFTPEQALLAAKAGAKYVSPFAGRVDDFIRSEAGMKFGKGDYFPIDGINGKEGLLEDNGIYSGVHLVGEIVEIFEEHNIKCQVLAASLRNSRQFRECALVGSDIATVPLEVLISLLDHHKTQEGMKNFVNDVVSEYKKIFSEEKMESLSAARRTPEKRSKGAKNGKKKKKSKKHKR